MHKGRANRTPPKQISWCKTLIVFNGLWPSTNCASQGIIAYNYTHADSVGTKFSLLHQGGCPDFNSRQAYEEKETTLQLLQRKEFSSIHGYGAKIVRTLFVLPCSGVPTTRMFTQRVLELSRREVNIIYSQSKWGGEYLQEISNGIIDELPYNGTITITRNLKESWTHEDYWCGGVDFTLHKLKYTNAILQGTYEVYLTEGELTVDLNSAVTSFKPSEVLLASTRPDIATTMYMGTSTGRQVS